MTLLDLADVIYEELNEPETLSSVQILYWLLNNSGKLNNLIAEELIIDKIDAEDFIPELTNEQADVYKTMYIVKYLSGLVMTNLGAAGYDWSELTEGDSTIRRVSRNEVSKTYKLLRDQYSNELNDLIFAYKNNRIRPDSNSINCKPYLIDSDYTPENKYNEYGGPYFY